MRFNAARRRALLFGTSRVNVLRFTAFLFLSFFLLGPLPGQEEKARQNYASLLAALEKKLGNTALPAAERRETLYALARLKQSAGNVEGAAEAWALAVHAEAGREDAGALLEWALSLMAMGEWDKAETAVKSALAAPSGQSLIKKARYIYAQLEAFRSSNPNYSGLVSLLRDPDFSAERSRIFYLLYRASGNEDYRAALVREYPESPEALMSRNSPASAVSASPTALWLLFPLGEEFVPSAGPSPAGAPATVSSPDKPAQSETARPSLLQVGLFSREENARAMGDKLGAKGFEARVAERTVNGKTYWAVGALPGPDYNAAILRLKDAGFESFPVF